MERYSREWHGRQKALETRNQRGIRRTADRSGHELNFAASSIAAYGTTDRLMPWTHRRQRLNALLRQRAQWRALSIPTAAANIALIDRGIRNVIRGGAL